MKFSFILTKYLILQCSASCGGGIKQRHIQCLNREMKYSTLCSDDERPADRASCNSDKCWTRPRPISKYISSV